jgi:hypothetical protein
MVVRVAKLIGLLLIAVGIGFLIGLLRPRRVVSHSAALIEPSDNLPRRSEL